MKRFLAATLLVLGIVFGTNAIARASINPITIPAGGIWTAPENNWIVVGNVLVNNIQAYSTTQPYVGDVIVTKTGTVISAEWGATAYPPFMFTVAQIDSNEDDHGCGRPSPDGCETVRNHQVLEGGSFTTEVYDPSKPPTAIPSPTVTVTPVLPTATVTATPTATNTPEPPTATPTATITATPQTPVSSCAYVENAGAQPVIIPAKSSHTVTTSEKCWVVVGHVEINGTKVYDPNVSDRQDLTQVREGNNIYSEWGATLFPPKFDGKNILFRADEQLRLSWVKVVFLHYVEVNGTIITRQFGGLSKLYLPFINK